MVHRAGVVETYGGLNALANHARRLVEQIDAVRGPVEQTQEA